MKEKQNEIGVIIARFQTPELHSEHKKLIDHVFSLHDKLIIFLGVSPTLGTRKHPLDFVTRKAMVEEYYSGIGITILPLLDQKSNEVWSNQIESKIREVYSTGSVTLYGGKDSFIPYYTGRFKTCELEPEVYVSATDIRKTVSKKTLGSYEFRCGIIYGVYNQYPTVHSTVDVAIFNDKGEILLGQKPNETEWRFIGGFVDTTDESEIVSVSREGREETGLELADFEFVCSKKVEDWRYKGMTDRSIMTHLYACRYVFGTPQPLDDISALKWFKYDENIVKILVEEHKKLFTELIKFHKIC